MPHRSKAQKNNSTPQKGSSGKTYKKAKSSAKKKSRKRRKHASKKSKALTTLAETETMPSEIDDILENVEQLTALHQEQGNQMTTIEFATDQIIQSVETKLETRFDQLEKQFETMLASLNNVDEKIELVSELVIDHSTESGQSDFKAFADENSSLAQKVESQLGEVNEKLELVSELVSDQANATNPGSNPTEWNSRFEALDLRISKIASAIQGQQELIESQIATGNEKTDSIVDSLQTRFDHILNEMTNRLGSCETEEAEGESEITSAKQDDSDSHWKKQKAEMMSKYGIDPERQPDIDQADSPVDPVQEVVAQSSNSSAEQALNGILESISPEDADVVNRLKEELNAKLRDAEVELSIGRAKLSQYNAELESKQVELERRSAKLTEKYSDHEAADVAANKLSMLDRLKRHLNAKDRKNLDRM